MPAARLVSRLLIGPETYVSIKGAVTDDMTRIGVVARATSLLRN